MARGLAEATAASKGTEYAARKLGASPETQQNVSNLAWLLPMLLRAGIQPEVQQGHTPQATPQPKPRHAEGMAVG